MKANVKVNVILHLNEEGGVGLDTLDPQGQQDEHTRRKNLSYPIALHLYGVTNVNGTEDAKNTAKTLSSAIARIFAQLNIEVPRDLAHQAVITSNGVNGHS